MTARVIRHVVVTGRVQGVGYRAWVSDEAAERKLEGWVRNRRDGTVEAVFSGYEQDVATMIAACRRGPSMARVDDVIESEAGDGLLMAQGAASFAMLPTV